ncbi:cuticle protein 16.8 [Trichonephila clavata]|uniref:Cuticle protein 16.8 n=1 Tax=Trichonephila clavata TaxID=2740835 RepID=A0A8X6IY07_TRICU|nr:cuticle protein 16.8 [Trichonephila clavata]
MDSVLTYHFLPSLKSMNNLDTYVQTNVFFISNRQPVQHHAPQPYKFGYSVKDKHGEQHREEAGDGHAVRGSYGFSDARGIRRQVNYVADHAGFRAQVKTNEPGTANQNPAAVHLISDAPYGHGGYAGNAGLGYAGVVAAPVVAAAPVRYADVVEAPVRYAGVVAAPVRYAGVAAAPVGYAGIVTAPIGINGLAGNEVLGYEGYDL